MYKTVQKTCCATVFYVTAFGFVDCIFLKIFFKSSISILWLGASVLLAHLLQAHKDPPGSAQIGTAEQLGQDAPGTPVRSSLRHRWHSQRSLPWRGALLPCWPCHRNFRGQWRQQQVLLPPGLCLLSSLVHGHWLYRGEVESDPWCAYFNKGQAD